MWPRVVEIMLGVWLSLSPFIFRHPPDMALWWATDFVAASLVWVLATLSFWDRTRRAHLFILPVSVLLIAVAYVASEHPAPPALQNQIAVGLLLLMLAIIPSRASEPPRAWLEYYERTR